MDLPVVLVVEDDATLSRVLSRFLPDVAYETIVVNRISEARVAAQQLGIRMRILVTDQHLNGRGTDLIRELRATAPWLQCIMLSGAPVDDPPDGTTVFDKPFDLREVKRSIREKLNLPG